MSDDRLLYSRKDAAAMLSISVRTLHSLISSGRIRAKYATAYAAPTPSLPGMKVLKEARGAPIKMSGMLSPVASRTVGKVASPTDAIERPVEP